MKIAFVSDNGENISAHFGRAPYYVVVEVEDKKEVSREKRDKMGHTHFQSSHSHEEHSSEGHGFSPQSQSKHVSMLAAIEDCSVVVCGGMGRGAVQSIKAAGKELRLTEVRDINQALEMFLADNLPNHEELSH
jgi:predicted Fe-Mo cluster-binding NifX family protein